jgi:hypothetical protein
MSIKKKFATAVATASLLAGLFGSAFVPSAMGAVILPSTPVVAKYTTLTEGGLVQQAGTAKVFGFQTNDSDDGGQLPALGEGVDDNTFIDIALFTAGTAGAGTTKLDLLAANNEGAVLKATSSNAAVNVGWAYDNDTTDILGEDGVDGDVLNDDADGIVDAVACSGDITVGTSSSVKEVTGSNNDATPSGVFRLCLAAETVATAATSTVTITWDGATVATFTVTAVGPIASLTASITDGFKYVAEDNAIVDDWFTIIAKDAAGVVINGLSTSVSNEDLTIYDWEDNPENAQGDVVEPLGGSANGNDSVYDEPDDDVQQYSVYDLDSNTCVSETGAGEEDGDAGSSYSVKFADDSSDASVVSNAITITCTGGIDGARVTKVTAEDTTGDMVYEGPTALDDDYIDIVATIVDADGAPLGDGTDITIDGSDDLDVDMVYSFDGNNDLNWNDHSNVVLGGEVVLGDLAPDVNPGKHTYTITFEDSDLSKDDGDEVEKVFTLSYTAAFVGYDGDISKKRNAAKTTATVVADFGDDGQYGKIQFVIQNANGAERVVTRNAGSDGAATLVFSRRNQRVSVTAYLAPYGSMNYVGETDTITIRFR